MKDCNFYICVRHESHTIYEVHGVLDAKGELHGRYRVLAHGGLACFPHGVVPSTCDWCPIGMFIKESYNIIDLGPVAGEGIITL